MTIGKALAVPPPDFPHVAFAALPLAPGWAPEIKSAGMEPGERGPEVTVALAPGYELGRAASIRIVCQTVRQLVCEMVLLASHRLPLRTARRRTGCHARQVAMYVCHVALRIPMGDVALAFGRDRTTVAHNCAVVEDHRDDAAFDDFVAAIERIVISVFSPAGGGGHE